MMKAKISPNMISFITVRRGEWYLKISVYKTSQIMVLAQHVYEMENVSIRFFTNQHEAADYIEFLVDQG